jgi:hypothetical protein
VLETRENDLEKSWLSTAKYSFGLGAPNCPVGHRTVRWGTGLSGGAPDSVRCARTSLGEQSTLGTRRRCTAINHQTVRWCTGLSSEPSTAKSSLSGSDQRRTAKIHRTVRWCTGLSGEPTVGRANGRLRNPRVTRGRANSLMGAPDSVRCANGSKSSTVGCAKLGKQSAPDSEQCLSGGTPDCPVRHPTEGKNCLPGLLSMAPSCLGAIKETPRRMEEDTKHSLIISKHQAFILTHLILCDSN